MGIFTKFKLTEVLSTFCYLTETISIKKLQNLKVIKYFINLINYYNLNKANITYDLMKFIINSKKIAENK